MTKRFNNLDEVSDFLGEQIKKIEKISRDIEACQTTKEKLLKNYDMIIFVIKNRGWKNGKLLEFIATSKYEINALYVDKECLNKLNREYGALKIHLHPYSW